MKQSSSWEACSRSASHKIPFRLCKPNFCTHFSSRHVCYMPRHLIILYCIILTISDVQYTLWSSSTFNFLQTPVTSSFLEATIHSKKTNVRNFDEDLKFYTFISNERLEDTSSTMCYVVCTAHTLAGGFQALLKALIDYSPSGNETCYEKPLG